MNVGDTINDCYLQGIGGIEHSGFKGTIEAADKDWTIIRTQEDKVIFVNMSPDNLNEFLNL